MDQTEIYLMKLLTCLFFCLTFLTGFSQKDKEKILANFDYVEYYPDSTIKEARKFSGTNLEGTTVEFNTAGEPVAIGNYKKGMKTGRWIYSDGAYSFFVLQKKDPELKVCLTEKQDEAGNKTGELKDRFEGILLWEFHQTYEVLLNPLVRKRMCNMIVSVPNTNINEITYPLILQHDFPNWLLTKRQRKNLGQF